jgi:hypothetical protein
MSEGSFGTRPGKPRGSGLFESFETCNRLMSSCRHDTRPPLSEREAFGADIGRFVEVLLKTYQVSEGPRDYVDRRAYE